MLNTINKQIAVTSNVCRPKCNVKQQNTETERWMRANPKRVKRLREGQSTHKRPNRLY